MKKFLFCILFIFSALTLYSCNNETPLNREADEYYRFTDSVGNEVILEEKPIKVCVLFSSYADIWCLSGGKVDITVGEAVERGFAEPTAVLVDAVAGHTTINLELLAAEEPDLVIGTADYACQVEACAFMASRGIPSALFKVEEFDDYLDVLKIFCDINGTSENYVTYGENVKNEIETLLETVNSLEPAYKKILFMRAGSTAKSTKAKNSQDNFACKMLTELGTINIADEASTLLDGLSMETIIDENPDFVFISSMGDAAASREYVTSLFENDVWQRLDCIKNGNYAFLPKELFHFKPNANWNTAYKYLINILYPELKID